MISWNILELRMPWPHLSFMRTCVWLSGTCSYIHFSLHLCCWKFSPSSKDLWPLSPQRMRTKPVKNVGSDSVVASTSPRCKKRRPCSQLSNLSAGVTRVSAFKECYNYVALSELRRRFMGAWVSCRPTSVDPPPLPRKQLTRAGMISSLTTANVYLQLRFLLPFWILHLQHVFPKPALCPNAWFPEQCEQCWTARSIQASILIVEFENHAPSHGWAYQWDAPPFRLV